MKIVKLFTLLSIVFITFSVSQAQNARIKRANEYYEAGGYAKAAEYYKEGLENSTDLDNDQIAVIFYKMAECYRLINNPKRAEMMYRKAESKGYNQPVLHLYYGDMARMNEKLELAVEQYKKYVQLVPDDPRGQNGLKSCELIESWKGTPSGHVVENMRVFNTKQSEFSPAIASEDGRTIYFTTSREGTAGKSESAATGEGFTDIFSISEDRTGRWDEAKPLSEAINTDVDEGICSFSSDLKEIYFTRCRVNKRDKLGCEIYVSEKDGDDWTLAEFIPISADSIVVAHPSISEDGLTLYFTSDLPGGFGGKDIWKVSRESKNADWGKPENLGPDINTKGEELFPYMRSNGVLYFSSNGYVGMGGLDIFKAVKSEQGKWTVENMRFPINSPADDFGIVFQGEFEKGYFSSSRNGGRGGDDVYRFHLPPINFNVTGIVKDEEQGTKISGATVKLVGSDGSVVNSESLDDGSFKFILKPNTDYVVVSSKKNFLNGKAKFTTRGLEQSKDFTEEILMTAYSREKTFELPNILYDFGSWELRPESLVALDRLIEILKDNPQIVIELGSHTDNRGSLELNYELSQNRAQAVVNYLIEKGINKGRLVAKGFASTQAKSVDEQLAMQHNFLKPGDKLSKQFIDALASEVEKEIAHQINRRTEFRVIGDNFVE